MFIKIIVSIIMISFLIEYLKKESEQKTLTLYVFLLVVSLFTHVSLN